MMALSIYFLVLAIFATVVVARDCSNDINIKTCDECMRCGGSWCYDSKIPRCTYDKKQCNSYENGMLAHNDSELTTVLIGETHTRNVTYSSTTQFKPIVTLIKWTQSKHVLENHSEAECADSLCTFQVHITPQEEFCLNNGSSAEYLEYNINFNGEQADIRLRYHVPCACPCTHQHVPYATLCNQHGDNQCGFCTCRKGWSGEFCENEICPAGRGDIPDSYSDEDCSGNGVLHCGECHCFEHLEGRKYFDENCRGICAELEESSDNCLLNPNLTSSCDGVIHYIPYNETKVEERDQLDRRNWVNCNKSFGECTVQYAASKDQLAYTLMIIKSCEPEVAPVVMPVNVAVPVVLGLAVLAVISAVAGFFAWKNMTPALPLMDPQYQNIDAELCQGENPLYICPTSSFKNPTYGKW